MTTEAAKIIIDADDLASKKFEIAAKNAERNIKAIKETGQKAKASTEFFGVLANTLGGTQLGSYAGQLGQLTEKVSQFSEVSKAGGAGALVFKAGLVAVVGVLAFQVGKAIGDVVFGTKELAREMDRARESAASLASELLKATSQSFSESKEGFELIRDPEEKEAAAKALLDRLNKDVEGLTGRLKQSQKAADEWADAWQITGNRKEFAKQAQAQAQEEKALLETLKAQRDELRRMTSDRTKDNEALREQNALQAKSESYVQTLRDQLELMNAKTGAEKAAIEAKRNAVGADTAEAQSLLVRIGLIEKVAEQEKAAAEEKKRILADQVAAEKAAMRDVERFKKEQAKYEQDKRIEAARDEVDALKKRAGETGPLAATEGRLLSRGGGAADPAAAIVENTKQANSLLQNAVKRLEDLVEDSRKPKPAGLEVELVG